MSLNHVLRDGRPRPQELARLPVQGIDEAGLARHPGHDLTNLAGLDARVDPAHLVGIRCDRCIDEQAFEGMVEVPVVVQVLVEPPNLAGLDVESQRRVVIKVLVLHPAEQELGRGRGDRGAPDRSDAAPGRSWPESRSLRAPVPRRARRPRSRRPVRRGPAPSAAATAPRRKRVVGHDHARLRPAPRPAAPPEITRPSAMIGPELCPAGVSW